MAQKMIDLKKCLNDIGIQCNNEFSSPDFHIQLSKNKYIKFYKSKCYNDYILTFNINKSKKIVLTRSMWKILFQNSNQINGAFLAN